MSDNYNAPSREGPISFVNAYDLERAASEVIPHGGLDYIRGGAGDEWTMRQNTCAFQHMQIVPRVLSNIENPNAATSLLGIKIPFPIIMTSCAAHGLAHTTAEMGTARGVKEAGTIMSVSTYANASIEEIADAGAGGPQFFQLYMSKDKGFNKAVVKEAERAKAKAVILTVDATVGGNREADVRNNFTMPLPMATLEKLSQGKGLSIHDIFANALQKISPKSIEEVASYTKLPVIVKGIQSAKDAKAAIDAGAAAIQVSNHGGRQLDGGPASFDVLSDIAAAVNKKVPIIFDSGIRRGQHIFKAIASGANVVAIGRPVLYGLALGGWQGVKEVFDYFHKDLLMVMQLAGTRTVKDIQKTKLLKNCAF